MFRLLDFKLSPCRSDDKYSSWVFPRRLVVIEDRRFGTLYRFHLQHVMKYE